MYIPVFVILLSPFIAMTGLFLAPRLRGKTESGEPKIFWNRFVKYALVLSAAMALVCIEAHISAGVGLLGIGPGFAVIEIAVSFVFGFSVVAMWLWPYSKKRIERIERSIPFKELRTGPMWGMFWASYFTVFYVVLGSILRVRYDFAIFPAYPLFFLLGAAGGAIWGASRMCEVKGWIVDDRVMLPIAYSDQSFQVFLRGCLIFIMFVPAPRLLAKVMFNSSDAVWVAAILGFFLGASVHRFIWVLQYEKRNNVRLAYEISKPDQPAELSAA